jgi:hypothetical protein
LFAEAAALPPGRTYELRRDALFRQEALSWIRHNPLEFVTGIFKKVVLLAIVDPDDRRSLHPVNILAWGVLVVLAGVGLSRLRPHGPEWRLVAAYALVSFCVPVLLVVLPRYRLPVDVVLFLPAAWLVSTHPWYEHLRRLLLRPWRRTASAH